MSRNPTGASETGMALEAHSALMEKTGLTPAGMGIASGMSPLGGGASGVNGSLSGIGTVGVRVQEEERRRRMEAVVALVGTRWGRVCQEGLERAAKRVGLECLWEEGRGGKRTLSIAGNGVLVDVEFHMEEVKGVTLEYMVSGSEVGKRAGEGAEVLKRDLTGGDEGGYVMLDAFVGNLERLAKMDKLSEDGVSCFDAVEGIRFALQSVFELEVGKTRDEKGPDAVKEAIDREVLCRGSGRPKMHAAGRVGLALQYWMERSLLLPVTQEPEAMDVNDDTAPPDEEPTIYSAIIETEALSSSLYPPIRISDSWLGSPIEQSTHTDSDPFTEHTSSLNWQEPPPTYISPSQPSEPSTIPTSPHDPLQGSQTPNVRFLARLEPPIVVPLQVAVDIYQSVNAPLTQESIQPTTYESLLFADVPVPQSQRTVTKTITSYDASGTPTEHRHQYTLFSLQPDYGRVIDSLPFSHPRQLIAILPLLRQWALVGSFIRRSFMPDLPSLTDATTTPANAPVTENGLDLEAVIREQEMTVEEELAAFLDEPSAPSEDYDGGAGALAVDITLSTTSSPPRIGVVWPGREGLRSVDFAVGQNGGIEVAGEDGVGVREGEREKVGKVLGIAEDIGVLVEWLRRDDSTGRGVGENGWRSRMA